MTTAQENAKRVCDLENLILDFLLHLSRPKFVGTDIGGERKDWIATQDVRDRLHEMLAN